jgi:hypothetical protein
MFCYVVAGGSITTALGDPSDPWPHIFSSFPNIEAEGIGGSDL